MAHTTKPLLRLRDPNPRWHGRNLFLPQSRRVPSRECKRTFNSRDPECPPYDYDEERIIFITDVFNKTDNQIEAGLVASPLSWSGETSMVMFNGKGGGYANGTLCNASLSTIDVEPGKTYRFRFISSTALTISSMMIEGHDNLTIVEADAHYTNPVSTSFLQMASGHRYSVIFTTKTTPEKETYYFQIESRERPTMTQGFAILKYHTCSDIASNTTYFPPSIAPLTLPNITQSFLEYTLSPLVSDPTFPTASEVTRRVYITVHQAVRGATIWLEDGLPWVQEYPTEPYLVSLYRNDSVEFPSLDRALANNGLDPVTRSFPAEIGEVIELVLQNSASDQNSMDVHPWHKHGPHFWDLGSGNGTYDPVANNAKWDALKAKGISPIQRDTTMLYRYEDVLKNGTLQGWRAWRFRVESPAVWLVHCHILQHMLMGMQTVWVLGNSSQLMGMVPQPEVQGYLNYGGSVLGNKSHYPEVVHFDDFWADQQ